MLLPELERRGQRPTVIVGTSTGAINAALVAAAADRDAEEAGRRLVQGWSTLERDDVFRSFVFHQAPLTAVRYVGEVLGVPGTPMSQPVGRLNVTSGGNARSAPTASSAPRNTPQTIGRCVTFLGHAGYLPPPDGSETCPRRPTGRRSTL